MKETAKNNFISQMEAGINTYEEMVRKHIENLQKSTANALFEIGHWSSTPRLVSAGITYKRNTQILMAIQRNKDKKIWEILDAFIKEETENQMRYTGSKSTSAWANAAEMTAAEERRHFLDYGKNLLDSLKNLDI